MKPSVALRDARREEATLRKAGHFADATQAKAKVARLEREAVAAYSGECRRKVEGELRRLKRQHAEAIKKQNKRHEGEFFKYRASLLQGT